MLQYTTTEAKAKFAEVITKVMAGEEIIVTRMGKEAARIVPPKTQDTRPSLLGLFEGQMKVPDDFNEWPEDIAKALGIID